MSPDQQLQVVQTADRLRDGFLVTLRELDRRAHRAMDVRTLLRENRRVVIAAGAGLAAVVVVIIGASAAVSRSRDSRVNERRLQGVRRAWDHPERLAPRSSVPRVAGTLVSLLSMVGLAAGVQLLRRRVQRALPPGK
ncbi:MAG TPA: hypothetical protein VGK85_00515 [Myxococcaceae bacterium]